MRKLRLVWIGKTQIPYVKSGINIYLKKISNYVKVNSLEIKSSQYGSFEKDRCRKQETIKMLKNMNPGEINIFLDEKGKRETSIGFSHWFEKQLQIGKNQINFFVGGAYGIDKSLLPKGVHILSLSDMTFTHQMVRLILLEQIYRALTIIHREPYHHI